MQHQNRIGIRRKKETAGAAVVARFLIPIYQGFIGRYFGLERWKGRKKEGGKDGNVQQCGGWVEPSR